RAGRGRRLRARGGPALARSADADAGGRVRVGIVGCGVISGHYAQNARAFDSFEIVACADLDRRAAEALAAEHAFAVATVDELIADPDVEIVLNLTPPAVHG